MDFEPENIFNTGPSRNALSWPRGPDLLHRRLSAAQLLQRSQLAQGAIAARPRAAFVAVESNKRLALVQKCQGRPLRLRQRGVGKSETVCQAVDEVNFRALDPQQVDLGFGGAQGKIPFPGLGSVVGQAECESLDLASYRGIVTRWDVEPMLNGVVPRSRLAGRGARSGAALRVAPVGSNLGRGCHVQPVFSATD
jgi:hypothetical protein